MALVSVAPSMEEQPPMQSQMPFYEENEDKNAFGKIQPTLRSPRGSLEKSNNSPQERISTRLSKSMLTRTIKLLFFPI
jgi:hypothetical protein